MICYEICNAFRQPRNVFATGLINLAVVSGRADFWRLVMDILTIFSSAKIDDSNLSVHNLY
jgi:hypothetical protein